DGRESHPREGVFELRMNDRQRMTMAEMDGAAGERDVDGSRGRGNSGRGFEALGPACFEFPFQCVRELAELFLLGRWGGGEPLHPFRADAVLASEMAVRHGLPLVRRPRRVQIVVEAGEDVFDRVQVRQGHTVRRAPKLSPTSPVGRVWQTPPGWRWRVPTG